MIDINKLRRLAQAATPHVGHACKYQDAHWLREGHVDFENADLFIASEREACAQLVEKNADVCGTNTMLCDVLRGNAAAIRARGNR